MLTLSKLDNDTSKKEMGAQIKKKGWKIDLHVFFICSAKWFIWSNIGLNNGFSIKSKASYSLLKTDLK